MAQMIFDVVTCLVVVVGVFLARRFDKINKGAVLEAIESKHQARLTKIDCEFAQGMAWIYFGMVAHLARGIDVPLPKPPPFPNPMDPADPTRRGRN